MSLIKLFPGGEFCLRDFPDQEQNILENPEIIKVFLARESLTRFPAGNRATQINIFTSVWLKGEPLYGSRLAPKTRDSIPRKTWYMGPYDKVD